LTDGFSIGPPERTTAPAGLFCVAERYRSALHSGEQSVLSDQHGV